MPQDIQLVILTREPYSVPTSITVGALREISRRARETGIDIDLLIPHRSINSTNAERQEQHRASQLLVRLGIPPGEEWRYFRDRLDRMRPDDPIPVEDRHRIAEMRELKTYLDRVSETTKNILDIAVRNGPAIVFMEANLHVGGGGAFPGGDLFVQWRDAYRRYVDTPLAHNIRIVLFHNNPGLIRAGNYPIMEVDFINRYQVVGANWGHAVAELHTAYVARVRSNAHLPRLRGNPWPIPSHGLDRELPRHNFTDKDWEDERYSPQARRVIRRGPMSDYMTRRMRRPGPGLF